MEQEARPWNVEFLKERFSECSDGFDPPRCAPRDAEVNTERQEYRCPCQQRRLPPGRYPYAFKLMSQEVGRWESGSA
jgi:hypothetical protein